jgi:hypothetical protein
MSPGVKKRITPLKGGCAIIYTAFSLVPSIWLSESLTETTLANITIIIIIIFTLQLLF